MKTVLHAFGSPGRLFLTQNRVIHSAMARLYWIAVCLFSGLMLAAGGDVVGNLFLSLAIRTCLGLMLGHMYFYLVCNYFEVDEFCRWLGKRLPRVAWFSPLPRYAAINRLLLPARRSRVILFNTAYVLVHLLASVPLGLFMVYCIFWGMALPVVSAYDHPLPEGHSFASLLVRTSLTLIGIGLYHFGVSLTLLGIARSLSPMTADEENRSAG